MRETRTEAGETLLKALDGCSAEFATSDEQRSEMHARDVEAIRRIEDQAANRIDVARLTRAIEETWPIGDWERNISEEAYAAELASAYAGDNLADTSDG